MTEVRLTPRAAAVLALLVERAQQIVTKEELLDRVWEMKGCRLSRPHGVPGGARFALVVDIVATVADKGLGRAIAHHVGTKVSAIRMANHNGASVDTASYWLHRIAGLNVPPTTPSSSTHTWQPAANVPFGSEFFNNLLGDAGDVSAEAWRRLRRQ